MTLFAGKKTPIIDVEDAKIKIESDKFMKSNRKTNRKIYVYVPRHLKHKTMTYTYKITGMKKEKMVQAVRYFCKVVETKIVPLCRPGIHEAILKNLTRA